MLEDDPEGQPVYLKAMQLKPTRPNPRTTRKQAKEERRITSRLWRSRHRHRRKQLTTWPHKHMHYTQLHKLPKDRPQQLPPTPQLPLPLQMRLQMQPPQPQPPRKLQQIPDQQRDLHSKVLEPMQLRIIITMATTITTPTLWQDP